MNTGPQVPPMSYEFDEASRQTALANYRPLPSTFTYYGIRQTITYGEFWVGLSDLEIIFIWTVFKETVPAIPAEFFDDWSSSPYLSPPVDFEFGDFVNSRNVGSHVGMKTGLRRRRRRAVQHNMDVSEWLVGMPDGEIIGVK